MIDTSMGFLVAAIISVVMIGVMFGARLRRMSPLLAGFVMVFTSYAVAAITMWGDDIGIFCVGSLLAISFGPITLGATLVLKKTGERTTNSDDTD